MIRRRRFGLMVALAALVLDQATKQWWLSLMAARPEGIELTPFFNLVMVWNRGVSFGLFNQGDGDMQRWMLVGFTSLVVLFLLVWLSRPIKVGVALGLGLVIGGAVGNIIDRLRFGAVADFLDVHAFGWHWPAFNVADAAIVVGVLLLLADALFQPQMAVK